MKSQGSAVITEQSEKADVSELLSKIDTLDFEGFTHLRSALISSGWSGLDCAEHNVYGALSHWDPVLFAPVNLSDNPQAQYRCHVAELFLKRWGFSEEFKAQMSVTAGVRASLEAIFAKLSSLGKVTLIPSDVYPFYTKTAMEKGVCLKTYQARDMHWSAQALSAAQCVLICDPIKPWGGSLSQSDVNVLEAWVKEDPTRLILIDAAYDIDLSEGVRELIKSGSCCVLASLSKGWLLPKRAGAVLSNAHWAPVMREALAALPKDVQGLRQGFEALDKLSERPQEVKEALETLREQCLSKLGWGGVDLEVHGYFASSTTSAKEWFEHGVLAIPSSVFGGISGSVISILPPIPPSSKA